MSAVVDTRALVLRARLKDLEARAARGELAPPATPTTSAEAELLAERLRSTRPSEQPAPPAK